VKCCSLDWKKTFFEFEISFFCWCLLNERMFMHIVYIWMTSSFPGSRPIKPIVWLKIFSDSRLQHEPSEGLMDFLAFLFKKLWQNKQKLIRETPLIHRKFLNKLGSFGHNFGTRNSRKPIKGCKDSYYSLQSKQTLVHNISSLSGRWRHKNKTKNQNIPQPWRHPPKTTNLNLKIFFSVQTTRLHESFDGLNSSLP